MKISYNWLKEFIEIDTDAATLAERLTLSGLELDGMERFGDDYIMDIEVTSNRGDCLSHLGVAREISAFSDNSVNLPKMLDDFPATGDSAFVSLKAPQICKRFTARIIRNVKIGESPEWLKTRLKSIGERPINNVADITNLVMHELGQPMHAFDLSNLNENRIVIRTAQPGEKIITLDDVERELTEKMLVICDATKPVAVAGIMGGENSGISANTTDVLLEVAYFDREEVRQTSRTLNLSSEASYHFERGVDINNLVNASNRAALLICELAGGEAAEFIDVYPVRFEQQTATSKNLKGEVARLSGLNIEGHEIERILKRLGFEHESKNSYKIPSWRHDVFTDEDLVEEVVRVNGYDKIAEALPVSPNSGEYQPYEMRKRKLRALLADFGFDEALTYSFIDTKFDNVFSPLSALVTKTDIKPFVEINDPVIEGASRMRATLFPGLLDSLRSNFNKRTKNVLLFEIGRTFINVDSRELPDEHELIGFIMSGATTYANRALTGADIGFFDAKGTVEAILDSLGIQDATYSPSIIGFLQSGQAAEIAVDGFPVGVFGKLNDSVAKDFKFKQPVFIGELNLGALLKMPFKDFVYTPLGQFPSISRDISLLLKRTISFDQIRECIFANDFELCRKVEFVEQFEGKGIAADEKSITIRLVYRSDERTLTDEEVEAIHQQIIANLVTKLNITQR
ncbi:MAG: phenylalanine--tRNA ligase subunit beta [Pyrinomonadaceae bacterium]